MKIFLYFIVALLMTFQHLIPTPGVNEELLHAGQHGTEDRIVKLLKIEGANINTTDKEGKTPLMHASAHQLPTIVHTLIDYKPKLDMQDNQGNTALIHAVIAGDRISNRQRKIVETLLDHGANPAIKNKNNESVLDIVHKKRQKNRMAQETIAAIERSMQ